MIRYYKRRLAILAAPLVAIFIASAPTFPAAAVELEASIPVVVEGQSITVSANVTPPVSAARDDYTITLFTPVQWPVPSSSEVNSGFGYRVAPCWGCSSYHEGVDFGGYAGEPIEAIAPGTVIFAGCFDALGCHVEIEHNVNGVSINSIYGHLLYGSIAVSQGQTVTMGQYLGGLGSTGMSTGNHLHFGISVSGVMVDPYSWIQANAEYNYQ